MTTHELAKILGALAYCRLQVGRLNTRTGEYVEELEVRLRLPKSLRRELAGIPLANGNGSGDVPWVASEVQAVLGLLAACRVAVGRQNGRTGAVAEELRLTLSVPKRRPEREAVGVRAANGNGHVPTSKFSEGPGMHT